MTRKGVLSAAFLGATAVVVGWELAAVARPGDDLEPWTNLIADHVPPAVTWAAIALLLSWLPGHFVHAYAQRGKTMDTTVTIPGTPEIGAPREPLLSVGTVTAIASAAVAVAVAFGLNLNATQTGAILAFVGFAAPLIVAGVGRSKVFAPATVRAMVVEAASSGEVKTGEATVPAEPGTVPRHSQSDVEPPA